LLLEVRLLFVLAFDDVDLVGGSGEGDKITVAPWRGWRNSSAGAGTGAGACAAVFGLVWFGLVWFGLATVVWFGLA
jgi:hypothetical protein